MRAMATIAVVGLGSSVGRSLIRWAPAALLAAAGMAGMAAGPPPSAPGPAAPAGPPAGARGAGAAAGPLAAPRAAGLGLKAGETLRPEKIEEIYRRILADWS